MTPAEARAKWVAALRSGAYQQGTHVLTRRLGDGSERDCCLGVACKVFIANDGELAMDPHSRSVANDGELAMDSHSRSVIRYTDHDGSQSHSVLPRAVKEWLGLDNEGGRLVDVDDEKYEDLTEANDDGVSFDTIADMIEDGSVLLA